MATKDDTLQMIQTLSEALLRDEEILSSSERILLTNVLRRARENGGSLPQLDDVVAERIVTAVGETLAERISRLVGSSLAQRMLDQKLVSGAAPGDEVTPLRAGGPQPHGGQSGGSQMGGPQPGGPQPGGPQPGGPQPGGPQPGGPQPGGPQPGGPQPGGPQPGGPQPGGPQPGGPQPGGPQPGGPQPGGPQPGGPQPRGPQPRASDVADLRREQLKAQYVVLDEFLAPEELDELIQYTLASEGEFKISEVIAPGVTASMVDFDHRRSQVLFNLGRHHSLIVERIQSYLPRILEQLGHAAFPISQVEAQITASNDGDFFRLHNDNAQDPLRMREITFVYFFHREPKAFRGGELRIYDSESHNGGYAAADSHKTIVPEQNQIVFFPSFQMHEVRPIDCPSRAFAESRFTLNGWLHR